MTAMKQLKDNQNKPFSDSDERKSFEMEMETETDGESRGSSSEETESPKSVAEWRKKLGYVHYQIRRIREEDSHLGEDIGEGGFNFNAKEKTITETVNWGNIVNNHSEMDHHHVVIFSRPSSPLRGKIKEQMER